METEVNGPHLASIGTRGEDPGEGDSSAKPHGFSTNIMMELASLYHWAMVKVLNFLLWHLPSKDREQSLITCWGWVEVKDHHIVFAETMLGDRVSLTVRVEESLSSQIDLFWYHPNNSVETHWL